MRLVRDSDIPVYREKKLGGDAYHDCYICEQYRIELQNREEESCALYASLLSLGGSVPSLKVNR